MEQPHDQKTVTKNAQQLPRPRRVIFLFRSSRLFIACFLRSKTKPNKETEWLDLVFQNRDAPKIQPNPPKQELEPLNLVILLDLRNRALQFLVFML